MRTSRLRWALLAAVVAWGGVVLPAQGWWITNPFNSAHWRDQSRDGHEKVTKDALVTVMGSSSTTLTPPQIMDIYFGLRDNDQRESSLLPVQGAAVRHHSNEAQRTHSMLSLHDVPGDWAYLGRPGFDRAVREAKEWVIAALMNGLRAFQNLPPGDSFAAGGTRVGAYLACKQRECRARHSSAYQQCYDYRDCPRPERAPTTPADAGAVTRLATEARIRFSSGWCVPNKERYREAQRRPFTEVDHRCMDEGASLVLGGRGRGVRRSRADQARGLPGDETRYNGFRWLGKALHALQDGFSCAHAIRTGSGEGKLCELLAYQGTCTPGGSRLHKSFDQGDRTSGCRWSAGATTASTRVIRAFLTARGQLMANRTLRARCESGAEPTTCRPGGAGTPTFATLMGNAVGPAYEKSPTACQPGPHKTWEATMSALGRPIPAGKRPGDLITTWGDRYLALGRTLPVGVSATRRIMTWADVARRRPRSNTADRDYLRQEQQLICGQESTSQFLSDAAWLMFERMGDNCKELPSRIMGTAGDPQRANKAREYFRENWSCAGDAAMAAWVAATNRYSSLRQRASQAGAQAQSLRTQLTNMWRTEVCARWQSFKPFIEEMLNRFEQLERALESVKHEVAQIMQCIGLREPLEYISNRVEDVTTFWNAFKVRFDRKMAEIKARLRTQAARALDAINPELRTSMRRVSDWWNETCLVERGGFLYQNVIRPLIDTGRPLVERVYTWAAGILGSSSNPVIQRMRAARRRVRELFQRIVSSGGRRLLSHASALTTRLGALARPLQEMITGGARNLTHALERTRTTLCGGGGLRARLSRFATWAQGVLGRLVEAGRRVAQRAVDELAAREPEIVRRYRRAGWEFVQRNGRAALQLLERYGTPAIGFFVGCREEYVSRGGETVSECIQRRMLEGQQAAARTARTVTRTVTQTARRVFNAAGYGICLLRACGSSPRQCLAQRGTDFDRDVRRCDRRYHFNSTAGFDKVRYLGCTVSCCRSSMLQCGRGHGSDFTPCVRRCRQQAATPSTGSRGASGRRGS